MAAASGQSASTATIVKPSHGFKDYFDAAQNARLVASAEQYYRLMYYGAAASWNLRDTHMFEVLSRLLDAHGPRAKAVVWAHNSHIGNASATAMGTDRQELNIGQLCRERFGTRAALIGLDIYTGTVAAASDWDGPMEVKRVLPARTDSYAFVAYEPGVPRVFVDLRANVASASAALRAALMTPRQERFIGVIYRPDTELVSHYALAVLPEQFDGWVWFEETAAVTPLPASNANANAAGHAGDVAVRTLVLIRRRLRRPHCTNVASERMVQPPEDIMMDFRFPHRAPYRIVICTVPLACALWSLPYPAIGAGPDASVPSSTGRTAAPRDTAAATDETITVDVKQALAEIRGLDAARIDVRSVDGVVRLQGAIRDESQRAAALKAAKDVRGVSAVSDELRVARTAP